MLKVDYLCGEKINIRMNQEGKATKKILMVCLGNICRSPLAEGILEHKAKAAGKNWQVKSAGTNSYHLGEQPHELSRKVANINGLDISGQRASAFIAADMEKFDLIYAMAEDVMEDIKEISGAAFDAGKVKLFREELPAEDMNVPDPWYGAEDGYHSVYKIIDDTCEAIIKKYD